MPPRYRTLLASVAAGLTYEKIAAEMGMPLGTVKSSLARARVIFRTIYLMTEEKPENLRSKRV